MKALTSQMPVVLPQVQRLAQLPAYLPTFAHVRRTVLVLRLKSSTASADPCAPRQLEHLIIFMEGRSPLREKDQHILALMSKFMAAS